LNALLDANVSEDKKNFLLTLLEYKKVTKTISTMQGWLDRQHPLTRKLHANFNQIGTSTGRYSSSNPNLQNIPSRDWDSGVRRCFVADEGYVLMEIDYSQAEVRVLAHYSNDPILLGIFGQEGLAGDPHTVTASHIWHIELEEVTKLQRTMAKQVTFGLPYGISPFGLWRRLVNDFDVEVTKEEVEELVANYLKLHSGVNEYLEATKEEVAEKGYIRNLVGIRRAFPVIKSRGKGYTHDKEVDRAKRQAVNHPIQGTVATMVKLSMVEADKLLDKPEYAGGQMIGQVHDSIMFHMPEAVADDFIAEFLPIMCNILELRVAMEADAEKGKSLYEVKGGKDAIASLHEHEEKFLASIGYKTT
jgi:DNA polymerase-1